MNNSFSYAYIAVHYPSFENGLCYKIPDALKESLKVGHIVQVPLGFRKSIGVILELAHQPINLPENFNLALVKNIECISCETFILDEQTLGLMKKTASYYHYSLGLFILETLPKFNNKILPLPKGQQGQNQSWPYSLSNNHKEIIDSILSDIYANLGCQKYLIHGVTGSGKSFIFFHLIQEILRAKKVVQFLVPEINLTPQFVNFFSQYLDVPVYVYHGTMSPKDRAKIWQFFQNDLSPKILIGVRSSIFVPIAQLGLIIMDEEHEQAFKQDSHCNYHTREVAFIKAKIHNVPFVMGSATPSVTSFYLCKERKPTRGKYFALKERFGNVEMPAIELVPHNTEYDAPIWPLTQEIIDQMNRVLDTKLQVLVFVNKLGHSSFIKCFKCGFNFECVHCSVKLRYFKIKNILKCHLCNWTRTMPESCPQCGCINLAHRGFGTERIESVIKENFMAHKIGRFDRDELKNIKSIQGRLDEFHAGELDILIGTQMMAKGHNFLKVGLVVVLGMDGHMNRPDFFALEQAYQLLHQVSGRAGRTDVGVSKVLVQTMDPNNPIFLHWKEFDTFYIQELKIRSTAMLPPYTFMCTLYWGHKNEKLAMESALLAHKFLMQYKCKNLTRFLGPRAMFVEKKLGFFYWELQILAADSVELSQLVDLYRKDGYVNKNVSLNIVRDPI